MLGNQLLDAIDATELEKLMPHLARVTLELRSPLYEPNMPIAHVHFPIDAVASLVSVIDGERTIEVATVGREGFVGLPVFLGSLSTPGRAFIQIAGDAWRMTTGDLRNVLARDGQLHAFMNRYTQALFSLIAQSAACNGGHNVEQRCSRWLLMTHDRVGRDEFPLTHDFLAQMLAVRRASVTDVANALSARGLIEYSRGIVRITDRRGLELTSCDCYAIIRAELARLLP